MIDDTKKEELVVEETAAPVAAPVAAEEAPLSLSIQDLAALRNIIDIASQRGAFKAEEFAAIGPVFNKLNSFISVVLPQIEQAKAAAEGKEVVQGE